MYTQIFALAGLLTSLLTPSAAAEMPQDIPDEDLVTLQGGLLVQTASPDTYIVRMCRWTTVTAYSSTPDQTDSTPFITASGSYVRDGIVACNFLRFGTRVRFPDMYGEKVFVVEDRMASYNSHKMDIWFASRDEAWQFGVRQLKVEVLDM